MHKSDVWICICILFPSVLFAQENRTNKLLMRPEKYLFIPYESGRTELSVKEYELYRLIMEYRLSQGKDSVPLSGSLTYVAQTHTGDLTDNHRQNAKCDMHSWSGKGHWTPCCYTKDHQNAACSWSKPVELTPYSGDGFEVVYFDYQEPEPEIVLEKWKKNPTNNEMLLNTGQWAKVAWKAMGIGIYRNYACVWFGKLPDKEGLPDLPVK